MMNTNKEALMDKKALHQEIAKLESKVATIQESLDSIKQTLQNIKELAWERESKKESSKMYKVLENEKPSTIVKSNVGDIVVDREFMEKEITKHLDNPALRGMVTTEELLSYPKVARGVEAQYEKRTKNYTWSVQTNDKNTLLYGSRAYKIHRTDINRLLTTYSKTNYGERQDRGERGQLRREFNDRDFLRPAERIITHNTPNTPLTQAELQRRLEINLRNSTKSDDLQQKQVFLQRAEALLKEAKKQDIQLDHQLLQTFKNQTNAMANLTITKEQK